LAPPRQSGVLNKSLGFERSLSNARGSLNLGADRGRSHLVRQAGPQSSSRGELFLANVPEGRTRHTRLLKP